MLTMSLTYKLHGSYKFLHQKTVCAISRKYSQQDLDQLNFLVVFGFRFR